MYITVNTTFTSTCYILTNKCCSLIENDEAYKQKEPTGKKRFKVRMKDRQRERKKDRKKERKKESKSTETRQSQ